MRIVRISGTKGELSWQGDQLVLTTPQKTRVLAEYVGGDYPSLRTFWGSMDGGYPIGVGPSLLIEGQPRAESYWSTVQGATFLVHFDPLTGRTAIRRDGGQAILSCTRGAQS
jgi:hypothetical protein